MNALTVEQSNMVGNAFMEHGSLVTQVARKYKGKNAEVGDLESYLNEKFIEAVLRFDPSKGVMGAYINKRLSQHAINYINSSYNQYRTETTPFSTIEGANGEGEEGDIDAMDLLKDEVDIANEVVEKDETLTILGQLFADATDLQKSIMQVYLKAEVKPSFTQIGKAVGVHHETVKRELKKLRNKVDFDFTSLA